MGMLESDGTLMVHGFHSARQPALQPRFESSTSTLFVHGSILRGPTRSTGAVHFVEPPTRLLVRVGPTIVFVG